MSSAVQTHEISRNFQNFFIQETNSLSFCVGWQWACTTDRGPRESDLKEYTRHVDCRAYTYNKTYSCSFKGETNIKFTEIPTGHAAKTVSRLWLVKKMGHFYVYNSPPGDWPLPRRRVAGAGIHNPGQCLSQRGEPLPGIAKTTFEQRTDI